MKRKTIELMEVKYTSDSDLDRLYNNPVYDTPFVIEGTDGSVHTVELVWNQGRGDNYQFESESCTIHPSDVAYIEDRIWNHIK